MANFDIASVRFSISPVSIMQCWVGTGWSVRGSAEEIREYELFSDEFFPFLINQDCDTRIVDACSLAVEKMDQVTRDNHLQTAFIGRFVSRLKGRLTVENQRAMTKFAAEHADLVRQWLGGRFHRCACRAVQLLAEWGLPAAYRALGAVGAFGNAVFGKYVNDLRAVCVQLDVVSYSASPAVQFLETLLHEEIHAAIHRELGDEKGRPELTWLNELCAVLTSHEAIARAAREVLDGDTAKSVADALGGLLAIQEYGGLATALVGDASDPLIPLKAWKRVFEMSDAARRDYARDRVITQILNELGWRVTFPYHFGKKYVTVFV